MIQGPEWEKLRATGIGGSEAAAAMGLSRWKTPLRLWHEKTGKTPTAKSVEYLDNLDALAVAWHQFSPSQFSLSTLAEG